MQAALDLRRTLKNVPDDEHDDAVRQTRLVSAWLTHVGNRQLIPSTAHLAHYALDHTPSPRPPSPRPGRPPTDPDSCSSSPPAAPPAAKPSCGRPSAASTPHAS